MSESTTFWEHIIFAFAPIGIIPAITSAIRVAGPNIMRAMIGKAREDHATAEAELMSSTSADVSELYDGGAVIRTTGGGVESAQLILVSSPPETNADDSKPECGLYTLEKRHPDLRSNSGRENEGKDQLADTEKGARATPDRVRDAMAPNISLNIYRQPSTPSLVAMAVAGVLLQLGVVVFATWTVHLPGFRDSFTNAGVEVPSYALPTFIAGTAVLVFGMFLCSHVVDKSSKEVEWSIKTGAEKKSLDSAGMSLV